MYEEEEDLPVRERLRRQHAEIEMIFQGMAKTEQMAPSDTQALARMLGEIQLELSNPDNATVMRQWEILRAFTDHHQWTPVQLHYLFMQLCVARIYYENVTLFEQLLRMEQSFGGDPR